MNQSMEIANFEVGNLWIIERALDDVQDIIQQRLAALLKEKRINGDDAGTVASWFLRSRVRTFHALGLKLNASDAHDFMRGLEHYAAHYPEQ